MPYILTLIILTALYVIFIRLMKYMNNITLTNVVFVLVIFVHYLMLSITVYDDVGFFDWNFQNTLPVANVSPFMFTCVPLSLILPKGVRRYFLLLISLLSIGMFLSGALGCIYNAVIGYKFHIHFVWDYVSHFAMSLFGVYVIKSKQVTLSLKNVIVSSSLIFGTATLMLILNLIFDTSFFGLSLNGKHNIYNVVLVDSSFISALLYYLGLLMTVILGYIYSMVFKGEKCIHEKKL